jgi:hypothetical protein
MIEEIGDQFLANWAVYYSFGEDSGPVTFEWNIDGLYIEIQYSIQGDTSLTIDTVAILTKFEKDNIQMEVVTPKGVFTNMIGYILRKLNKKDFRVRLMHIVNPDWFAKLLQRGWEPVSKPNIDSRYCSFYEYVDTSLYITLENFQQTR